MENVTILELLAALRAAIASEDDPAMLATADKLAPLIGEQATIALVRAFTVEVCYGTPSMRILPPARPINFA